MTARLDSTPAADGFRMPGEFEKHAGTWMIWPQRPDNWRNGGKPAQKAYVEVASAIAKYEPVTMLVNADQFENARHLLPPEVRVVEMSNDDAWARDCACTFVVNDASEVRAISWEFNAWGGLVDGLYFPWAKDDEIARKMADLERVDYYQAPFVLEGGSIHTDGAGTAFVTEECLLSEGRNPDLSQEEIEEYLKAYMGVKKVIWLKRGIYNDETNGHIDNIMAPVRPGVIVLAWTDDKDDPQYEISAENLAILEAATDARGEKFEIHKMYVPSPLLITAEESEGVDAVDGTLPREEGDRQAASYVNYYVVNGAVLVPVFDDPRDKDAQELLAGLYPDRDIVPIALSREIILGGGNIHCITQQQPRAHQASALSVE